MKEDLSTYFLTTDKAENEVVLAITHLINAAFAKGEAGMWDARKPRTNVAEMTAKINAQELIVAEVDGKIVGTVCVSPAKEGNAGVFGMLAVAEAHTGQGIGARLIAAAEDWALGRGLTEMRLEFLEPRDWAHPAKEVLKKWYAKLGYQPSQALSFYELYAEPSKMLVTVCDFTAWSKVLKKQ